MTMNPELFKYLYPSKEWGLNISKETPEDIIEELKKVDEEYFKVYKKHIINFK